MNDNPVIFFPPDNPDKVFIFERMPLPMQEARVLVSFQMKPKDRKILHAACQKRKLVTLPKTRGVPKILRPAKFSPISSI